MVTDNTYSVAYFRESAYLIQVLPFASPTPKAALKTDLSLLANFNSSVSLVLLLLISF